MIVRLYKMAFRNPLANNFIINYTFVLTTCTFKVSIVYVNNTPHK